MDDHPIHNTAITSTTIHFCVKHQYLKQCAIIIELIVI